MPQYNFNRTIAVNNTLTRISAATKINNLTRGSFLRILAESNATDIEVAINSANDALNQRYIETATGKFLDKKAFDLGLSRNVIDKLVIFKEDQAIRLEVLTEGKTFKDFVDIDNSTFIAGEVIANINSQYQIILLEDLVLNPNASFQYVSVRIEPIGGITSTNANYNFSIDQIITIRPSSSIGLITNKLQLRVTKSIIVESVNETDEQLRSRLFDSLGNLTQGTPESVSNLLRNIPELIGYNIQQNLRNDNSIDFYIVTKSYVDNTNFSFIPLYITNLARSMFGVNTDIQVKYPKKLELYIEYTSASSLPDESIKEVIKNTVNNFFVYSQENIINKKSLEDAIKSTLRDLKEFNITQISAYDSDISEFIIISTEDLELPFNYFAYVSDVGTITNG